MPNPAQQSPPDPVAPVRVAGIDLSHHQNDRAPIDWPRLLDATDPRIDVVIAKATQGVGFVDPCWVENTERPREAGRIVGVYHFLDMTGSGREQAEHFLATIEEASEVPDILALDVEWIEGKVWNPPVFAAEEALAFLTLVEETTGITPIVYVAPGFASSHGFASVPELGRFPAWFCDWRRGRTEPQVVAPWVEWTHWQHTNKAMIPGIKGDVDLNVFRLPPALFDE